MPLQNLCGYMEEAAAIHAAKLGFSVEELAKRRLAWAITSNWIEFHNLPYLGGDVLNQEDASWVQVKTWPVSVERLRYRRDFLITWRGAVLAKAVTDWVVINLETRRVERIPEFICRLQPEQPEFVMDVGRLRLKSRVNTIERNSFVVRKADIDRNNHVNNARFTEWIVESVPDEVSSKRQIKGLHILYLAEGKYGDDVIAQSSSESEDRLLHSLCRKSDGLELVRARSIWI